MNSIAAVLTVFSLSFQHASIQPDSIPTLSNVVEPVSNWSPPPADDVKLNSVSRLPPELNESSGLVYLSDGIFIGHNDSGSKPILYKIDETGKLISQIHISDGVNMDWEDITKDKNGKVYVGDIGNNFNNRKDLTIYVLNSADLNGDTATARCIFFEYENQTEFPPSREFRNFDSESLIHRNDSLYIFTKNRTDPFTGYTYVYSLPDQPGRYKAHLVDSLKLGDGIMTDYWVTGADLSPNGEMIALMGHEKLWILRCLKDKKLSEAEIFEFRLNSFTQKESVAFVDDLTVYLTDERIRNVLGGNLYKLNLPKRVLIPCE